MPAFVSESANYAQITATTTVAPSQVALLGIFVSAASATPTITVSDGSVTMVSVFTPVAGTFYPLPARAQTSLIVTISGTVSCTVFFSY